LTSRRDLEREPKAHALEALVLAWMLILTIILPSVAASDPNLTPFGPVDKKYTWEFDDLANYTLGNAVIDNGTLELASTQTSVSVTSQQDFLNGTVSNVDPSDPGNMTLTMAAPYPFQFETTLGSNNLSDTYLTNLTSTFNFGGSSNLLIGNDALGVTYRSLLKINESVLSYIPSDAQLMSASLSIYQMSGAYPGNINIYSSSSNWTEGTGDWNGTLIWLWVNETENVRRTNEPVIVDLLLPPIRISDPDRRLILYDSTGVEYPSRILNTTYSSGYLTSIRLGLAVTISQLESEGFSLKLMDAGGLLPSYRDHAVDPVSLWSGSIGSALVSPVVADFNRDGYLEMAFFDAMTRTIYAYHWDGTPFWTYLANENLDLAPTAADVNLDGRMELIYPSNSLGLRVLDAETGTLLPGYTLPGGASSQAAVNDINGDGIPEILIMSNPPRALYCLSGVTGSIIWQDTASISQAGIALAIGNFNASAGLEVAVALNDGTVLTFSATGTLEWTAKPSTADYGSSFAVARIDGDQFEDLVLGLNKKPGFVFALNGTTGKTLWSFSTATSSSYASGLAVADINKDGYMETVALAAANGLHQVIALSNTGSELWNYTIPEIGGIGEISRGAISIADFNGDGDPEIFIGDRNGSVRVFSSSGTMLRTIIVSALKGIQDNPPLFADLTGNDSLEMITSNDKGIMVTGIYGFSYDWRIESRDATLGSAVKNLSSAEGTARLNAEWNPVLYPTMPANWTFATDAITWATPGGDYNPVSISSSSVTGAGTWAVLNITGIISAWLGSGRTQMDSIFLMPQDSSVGTAKFSSSNEPIFALHPIITVSYRLMRYASSGSFVSDPLGFSWPNQWEWGRAEWSAGSGTNVSMEVRVGNSSNPGDGTWSGWSLLALPGDFSKVNVSFVGSHLQFRIVLSTTNYSQTPIFSGIEFGGVSYAYHGWAMTADVNPPGGINHWNQSWANYTSNGATVTLNYSTDGGTTWTSIAPSGNISKADASSGLFRLRVDLYSRDYPSDSATTPLVFNLTATYSIVSIPLAPPYILPRIPDQAVMEDAMAWTVDLLSSLHDVNDAASNLRWYTLNESFISVSGENVTGNMIMMLSVSANAFGTAEMTFVLVDSDGMTATQLLNVTVASVNDPPVIDPVSNFIIPYDTQIILNLTSYVHDVETTKNLLNLTALGANASYISISGLLATFLIPQSKNGTDVGFTLAVDDGTLSAQTSFMVHVTAAAPPYISPRIPDQTVPEDSPVWSIDLTGYVHDANDPNSLLRWYVTNESFATIFGENITGNMMMIFSVPANTFGATALEFILLDSDDYSTSQTINLTVTSVNDRPQIDPVPDFAVQYGVSFNFNFSAYVRDIETQKNLLNLSIIGINASYVSFSGLVGTFLLPLNLNGTEVWFTIAVDDGGLSANTTFKVSVAAALPPYISPAIPDQIKPEDTVPWTVDLTGFLHDANDANSALRWYTLNETFVSVFGENVTGNMIMTLSVPANTFGNASFELVLIDSDGMLATQSFNVTIVSVNDVPYILPSVPDQMKTEDSPSWSIDLTSYLHDPDDPVSSLHWYVANRSFVSITGNNISGNMLMTFSVPANLFGSARLTLVVEDPSGGSAVQTFDVAILSVNDPPAISPSIPDQIKAEDSIPWSLDLGAYIHDDVDPQSLLRWYITGESFVRVFGENITGNMVLVFVLPANAYGTTTMRIVVTDSVGASSSQTFKVTITPVNDPPEFDYVPDFTVHFEVAYQFNFAPYVRDIETPRTMLNISASGADASYVSFDGLVGAFLLPKSLNGTNVQFTISVDDGNLSDSITLNVLVSSDFPPSLNVPLPAITMQQGEMMLGALNLTSYFIDIDDSTLFLTVGNSHVSISINQKTKMVDLHAPIDWYGTEEVIFRAIDPSNARAEGAMTITVLKGSSPPNFWQIPDLIVRYNNPYSFDLGPYVYDPDTPLSDLVFTVLTANVSSNITFSEGTMTLTLPFTLLGHTIPVDIEVSDGGAYPDRTVFRIKVVDDYPPTISSLLPDHSFFEDSPMAYPMSASLSDFFSDVDIGDVLAYSAVVWNKNVTPVLSVVGVDILINFTQTIHWYGSTEMTIRATDTAGAFVEKTVSLVVTKINYLPVIGLIGVIKVVAGREAIVDIGMNISDIETPTEMLLISSSLPQYVHGLSGKLYVQFPRNYTGGANVSYVNLTLKVRDLDGGESYRVVTIMVQHSPEERQAQEAYLWWFILTTAAIAGLLAIILVGRLTRKPFVIQDIMLIHSNGILLARSAGADQVKVDDEIFSGMLTAVLDFVEDSFKAGDNEMKRFEFRDYSVALQRGAHSFVAVAYSGSIPKDLDKSLEELMGRIENIYGKRIENFSGDAAKDLAGIDMVFNTFKHDHSKSLNSNGSKAPEKAP
jgi:hypothetical protein